MGQRSSCCQDDEVHAVQPVEVVHHLQDAEPSEGRRNWETCVPGGGPAGPAGPAATGSPASPGTPEAIDDDTESPVKSRASAVSLAQCRLQRMDHLLVDRDILRGIALRETLNSAGRLWRKSPIDMDDDDKNKLWTRSRKVESFDWFLSHTWLTPGWRKVLSLVMQSCWHFWLGSWIVLVTLAVVLCTLEVLPMTGSWHPEIMGFSAVCPMGGWVIGASCLAPILGITSGLSLPLRSPMCFLDVVSIHQTNAELMERGIYGLGGFLQVSKELRILWSPPYLTRLWCVFEVAAFRTANPKGRIVLHPIAIERGIVAMFLACTFGTVFYQIFLAGIIDIGSWQGIVFLPGLIPSYGAMRILKNQSSMKTILLSQLRNFDVDKAQCRDQFDRHYIEAAILQWYGSKEKFAAYVRGPLAFELLRRLSENHATTTGYGLIVLSVPVAAGFEWCLSLWMGGAPWEAVLSWFIGIVIGVDFLCLATILMTCMLLSESLATPCFGVTLPDHLQTVLVSVIFAGTFASAMATGMAAASFSLWTSILLALGCFGLLCIVNAISKKMLLRDTSDVHVEA